MNTKLEWSDSIEHTLDMVRLNCVNLSEYHQQKYEKFRSRSNMYQLPVFLLSAGNAYAALGISKYLKQAYISDINCGVSIIVALFIVVQYLLSYQKQMEDELIKFKEYYLLSAQIFKVLSVEREDRKIDGKLFLEEKFSKYEELVNTSDIIQEYKEDLLDQPDNMITKHIVDAKDQNEKSKYLFDHWNILYQPKLYALKKRNANILKFLRETWNDTFGKKEKNEGDIENPDEEKKDDKILENPFYNPFSYDIFKTEFMKDRLAQDQKDLDTVRKTVKQEMAKKSSNKVKMEFL